MPKNFTTKQMGDACEMLVAAEMTLAGVPALKVPDNWPGYDVIAQPRGAPPVRISVKARTYRDGSDQYVGYYDREAFDWIGLVLCDVPGGGRRVYLVQRSTFESVSRSDVNSKYVRLDQVDKIFGAFESNFRLRTEGLVANRIAPLNRGRPRVRQPKVSEPVTPDTKPPSPNRA